MSRLRQLITVLHQRSVWQVLLVYIGVSWGLLEATGLFIEQFGLPAWAFPAAVLLLVIGLVILLATAWMQVQPAAQAPDAPTPWEVDLVSLKESVARGRLPHLTWARAILGGVVAFSLLFGFAGLYVLLSGPPRAVPVSGASDGEAAPGIAVLPFHVVGSPEPLFVEGEPRYQSLNDAIAEDCGLAGGTAYVTSDGKVGCIPHDVEDSRDELVSPSQPPAIEPTPAPAPE